MTAKRYKAKRALDWIKRRISFRYSNRCSILAFFFIAIISLSLISVPSFTQPLRKQSIIRLNSKIIDTSNSHFIIGFKSKLNEYTTTDSDVINNYFKINTKLPESHSFLNLIGRKFVNLFRHILFYLKNSYSYKNDNTNFLKSQNMQLDNIVKSRQLKTYKTHHNPKTLYSNFIKMGFYPLNETSKLLTTCRNTFQGPHLITDEMGYVCPIFSLKNGCCQNLKPTNESKVEEFFQPVVNISSHRLSLLSTTAQGNINGNQSKPEKLYSSTTSSSRFVCDSCDGNYCCSIYEHCVSCCLDPKKKHIIDSVLHRWWRWKSDDSSINSADGRDLALSQSRDYFEACLAKCRTSSRSVMHENSYRDPRDKFCFSQQMPHIKIDQAIIPNRI